MNILKKVLRFLINFISIAVIVAALMVLLSVLVTRNGQAPSFLGYSAFRVMSGSMEPTLPTNTMIVVKQVPPEEIEVGDVITFISSDPSLGGSVNTHRVTAIAEEGGERVFTTKGDANYIDDKYPVKGTELIGVLVYSSVALGTVVRLASNPIIFVPLILVPLLTMLIMNLVKSVRLTKKMADEEGTDGTGEET